MQTVSRFLFFLGAEFLDEVLRDHAREFPDLPLVWRSQLGSGCGSAPLRRARDAPAWKRYEAEGQSARRYPKLAGFDDIARARVKGPSLRFLDLGALALRPDWRVGSAPGSPYPVDCTHFCAAGPLEDLVPRLFLQLLRDLPAGGTAQD